MAARTLYRVETPNDVSIYLSHWVSKCRKILQPSQDIFYCHQHPFFVFFFFLLFLGFFHSLEHKLTHTHTQSLLCWAMRLNCLPKKPTHNPATWKPPCTAERHSDAQRIICIYSFLEIVWNAKKYAADGMSLKKRRKFLARIQRIKTQPPKKRDHNVWRRRCVYNSAQCAGVCVSCATVRRRQEIKSTKKTHTKVAALARVQLQSPKITTMAAHFCVCFVTSHCCCCCFFCFSFVLGSKWSAYEIGGAAATNSNTIADIMHF